MGNPKQISFLKWVGVVSIFIFCFTVQPASAKIYKWKDDTGKVFFTDDESKIPAKFRKGNSIKKVREVRPVSGGTGGGTSSSGGSADPVADTEEEKPAGILSAKDKTIVKSAVALLKKEVAKDKTIVKFTLSDRKAKNIVRQLQSAIPEKKKVLADLEKVKAPEAGATAGFLKTSITADEALSVNMPRVRNRVAQEQGRLRGEITKANQLTRQLDDALKKSDELEAEAEAAE